jgi:very-short-patch-repair endonuclease/predicted transcriptional regulator of viral defense system
LFRAWPGAHDAGMRELPRFVAGIRQEPGEVRAIAAKQAGIVTRAQLLVGGVSSSAIQRAVRSGRLHRVHPGVYSTVAPELITEDGLLIAALHVAGPGAVLSHGTAAWRWHLIPAPPTRIELAVTRQRAAPQEVVLHETELRPTDTTHQALPTTTVPRTLLDLATRYSHNALLRALAEAEFHHDLRPADILQTLRRGHPGSARLRAALDAHAPGHGGVRSNLERRFRRLLIRNNIELPLRNEQLGPWTVDCVWPDRRVVVELDGRQHERPHQADTDDDRDLWLRSNGYVARRYGQRQVDERPDAVIADLRNAFAEAVALYATAGVPLRL